MRVFAVLVSLSVALASVVQAGPVVPGDIPRDAKWFGHINVDAIHSMDVVRDFREKMEESGRWKDRMQDFAEKTGMNPMEDLRGITVYATQYEGDSGVGLLYVKKVDRKKLLNMLQEEQVDHEMSQHGDRALYSWTVKHRRGQMKLTGAFASKKLIVIGSDEASVKSALDVVDGKADGLDAESPLLAGASKKSLFVSNAVDVPDAYREQTKCPVLRKCTAASVNWTEKKGAITGKYVLTAESDDMANGFKAMVDTALTMGRSRLEEMEAAKKVMDGLTCNAKGAVFTLTLKTTTDDVHAAVRQMMERLGR